MQEDKPLVLACHKLMLELGSLRVTSLSWMSRIMMAYGPHKPCNIRLPQWGVRLVVRSFAFGLG